MITVYLLWGWGLTHEIEKYCMRSLDQRDGLTCETEIIDRRGMP